MRVRAYDSNTNTFFQSEVLAVINGGWYERHLLIVPSANGACVKFFDYLDKSDPENAKVLINRIIPGVPKEWIYQRSTSVDKPLSGFIGLRIKGIRFFEYNGYPWIFENKSLMRKLLRSNAIPVKGSVFEDRTFDYKINGWNYVETQSDVKFLLSQTCSFHDSVLKKLEYISGAYVDDNNAMFPIDSIRQITMRIDSQQCKPIEMLFEGVMALNLRPAGDNYSADIFEASLFLKDASVFFYDEKIDDIDESYDGTWIRAYSARWRFVE